MNFDSCPECGGELQATIPVYVSRVEVDNNGVVVDCEFAFEGDCDSSAKQLVLNNDGEGVRIYCENDHEFDLEDAKAERRNAPPEEPPLDSPSLEDTMFNHADPINR